MSLSVRFLCGKINLTFSGGHCMKKWWQNTNRGVLLLLVVLFAVAIYLVCDAINIRKEKKTVKDLASQYAIESSCMYSFPSGLDYWSWNGFDITDLIPAIHNQAEPLKHYFYDNETVQEQETDKFVYFFRYCFDRQLCPVSATKQITDIKFHEIYNGSASITVYSKTTVEFLDAGGKKVVNEMDSDDTLSFLKINGEWKIVKADCSLNNYEGWF